LSAIHIDTDVARRAPLERTIGWSGIAGTVLLFAATIATATNEPQLDATTTDAADFIKSLDTSWITPVEAVADIGMMVLLWFIVGLPLLLRRHEGEVPVRSTVAMLSGALVAGFVVLDTGYQAGAHRSAELDDAQLAFAYDLTQIGFTNIWLPMGVFAFASGWLMVSTGSMPGWLGRWGIVAGIALALAQLTGLSGAGWVPYLAFWAWLLATCAVLVRTPAAPDHRTARTSER
jgi:hypothetical protein